MNSLGRAIKLLEMMGRHSGGLTNSQISRFLHISTSSTSYLLSQLEGEGCVKRDEDTGRYQVGLRLVSLAHGALHATGFQELSGPVLHRLAASTGLTATIGVLERGEVLLLERVHSAGSLDAELQGAPLPFQTSRKMNRTNPARVPLSADIAMGAREPIWASASGRILASFLPQEQLIELAAKDGRSARDPNSVTGFGSVHGLLEELKRVRIQGHALFDAGGNRSVAAPITSRSGGVVAALAVFGPRLDPMWTEACHILNLVREAAFQISRGTVHPPSRSAPESRGRLARSHGAVKAGAVKAGAVKAGADLG